MKKTCNKCKVEKEATRELFYRDAKGKYGLRPYCIECEKKRFTSGYKRGKEGHVEGNRYEIFDTYAIGYTKKDEPFYLDVEDVDLAKQYTWHLDIEGYASAGGKTINGVRKNTYKLHREVMRLKSNDGKVVDHINRERIDNRKSNLRLVSVQENAFNTSKSNKNKSGVVGVFYRERKGKKPKWIASINIEGKTRQIGHFDNMDDAIKARKEAEIKHYNGMRFEEGLL
jgi:hypothetical protein